MTWKLNKLWSACLFFVVFFNQSLTLFPSRADDRHLVDKSFIVGQCLAVGHLMVIRTLRQSQPKSKQSTLRLCLFDYTLQGNWSLTFIHSFIPVISIAPLEEMLYKFRSSADVEYVIKAMFYSRIVHSTLQGWKSSLLADTSCIRCRHSIDSGC